MLEDSVLRRAKSHRMVSPIRAWGRISILAAAASLALTACAHHPTPPPTAFPAPPIADLSAPLPKAAKVTTGDLKDILNAGIADEQAIALLSEEVRAWRGWWADQAKNAPR
jgi:hypothetical protein